MSKLHKHPRVLPAKMETEREKYDAYEWCKSELRRTREAGEYDGDPEQWHPAARLTRLAEDPTSTCRARALDSHPGLLQRRSFHCRTWGPPYIGTPVEPKNLHRDFVRVLKVAEVPRIRFHDPRHSAASLLLAQGGAAPDDHGAARPQFDRSDRQYLRACHAERDARGRRQDGSYYRRRDQKDTLRLIILPRSSH